SRCRHQGDVARFPSAVLPYGWVTQGLALPGASVLSMSMPASAATSTNAGEHPAADCANNWAARSLPDGQASRSRQALALWELFGLAVVNERSVGRQPSGPAAGIERVWRLGGSYPSGATSD